MPIALEGKPQKEPTYTIFPSASDCIHNKHTELFPGVDEYFINFKRFWGFLNKRQSPGFREDDRLVARVARLEQG